MDFCILSPIAGLRRYATLSKTHLLLPQLDALPGYRDFYIERQKAGDFLILDNGAYEGQKDWKLLVDCISIYNPNVVALPDYLLQDWMKTTREAFMFLDRYYYNFPTTEWMFVPQAEEGDIMGFIDGLFKALDDPRITWIGLPRALSYAITDDLLMRVKIAERIKRRRGNIKLHALGMVKGSVSELSALRKSGVVNSIDSNAPVWRGWNNWDLTVPVKYNFGQPPERWPEIPIKYDDIIPISCTDRGREEGVHGAHQLILKNLEAVGVDTTNARAGSNSQREVTPHS